MKNRSAIMCMLLLAPCPALASAAKPVPVPVPEAESVDQSDSKGAYAQVYYYPVAEREKQSAAGAQTDYEGDGFGISAVFPFVVGGQRLFAVADYSTIDYDEVTPSDRDDKIDEWRLGLGYQFGPRLSAYLHYNDRDNGQNGAGTRDVGSDGYAVHGVYTLPFADTPFTAYADVGYFRLENQDGIDIDGFEYWLGGLFAINARYSSFIDYRASDFDVDNGIGIKYYDFRLGLRMSF